MDRAMPGSEKIRDERPRKVLVIGDDTRSFLATVRSLAKRGIEVHAAPFDFRAPALKSRYVARIRYLPYYLGDGTEWLAAVEELLRRERYDLVIPCDERTLLPLHHHRDRLAKACRLAIPNERAMAVLFDKLATRELARSLGIPVARGRLISEADTTGSIAGEAGLPLVVKPLQSYTLDSLHARGKVAFANNEAALSRILPSARDGKHFFEVFLPGDGVGVSVLASRGKVLQAFQHRRVHEWNGNGYYRVSAPLSPPLLDAAAKIIAALDYTGVAMFEFKINRNSGAWILLEVNARPWGSMPLPVGLGVDFPYFWYRLLVDGVETPSRSYRAGVYARNLVPDFRQFAAHLRALRSRPAIQLRLLLRWTWEHARLITGREFHDVLTFDDPRPGLAEIGGTFRQAWQRLLSRQPGFAARTRRRDRAALRAALREAGGGDFTIVFVCQGNICRSPFAAAILDARTTSGRPKLRAASAGMLPRNGAVSPSEAITAALEARVKLAAHRSLHLSREMAESASVLAVFDEKNLDWLRNRYPGLATPVVRLGSFGGARELDIADPVGRDAATFRDRYARIAAAIDGLLLEIHQAKTAAPSGEGTVRFPVKTRPPVLKAARTWLHSLRRTTG
jgi:protein-tyrosine-phosphatase/predicted ATP-grasp superfamily ATP-dependent carboligase